MSSTSGINFSGLASGVDTGAIIDQLIKVASAPMQTQQDLLAREKKRQATLTDLSSKIAAMKAAADDLRSVTFWAGGPHAVSGDEKSYTIAASSGSPKASFAVQVKRLATADLWVQAATSGVRQLASLGSGPATTPGGTAPFAAGTTKLTALTSTSGTSLGLQAGQTITLNATKGGAPITKTYAVTADSTLDDLKAFVQTSIPGSSVAIGTGGRLQVTSGVGTDQEATALSLTTGGAAALFDATFASSTSTRAATGLGTIQADDTLHLTVGSLSYDVAVKAGWSMDRVAAEINAANGGISAATAGGRLRLNGVETGATNVISVSSTGTTAADLGLVHAGTAQDAIVNVDGQDVTTSSNTTTDVIPGATMTLLATSTTATSATTDPKFIDPDEATNRVQKMVDAYNQVMLAIDGQVTEKHVVNAKTSADKLSGVLFGDSTLNGIRATMQNAMADLVGGIAVGKNIAKSIGLGTAAFDQNAGAGSLDGQLQFDAATFKKALADDPDSVKILLTNDGTTRTSDGLAQRLSDLATSYTSTNGGLKAKIDGSDDEIKRINEQIDRMQARIDAERTRLTTQFTAMETAMSQLKSSQAQMQSQLSSLG